MVVALQHLQIPGGFRKVKQAVVDSAKLEIRQHPDNVR
jgi:hypothetical protein